ncbi:YraN family protein [Granulosicoccaceae sp. 1_MG-2023]|nr:YraN family protein [Granulosicoccaceae sp. 1_MG-2023]
MKTQTTGKWGELQARNFLESHGLEFIQSNYLTRMGEIDLIMRDGDTLVFTEVRTRNTERYGGGIASVTKAKQRKLCRAALSYLQTNRQMEHPCRFDVVAINTDNSSTTFEWIKNAFDYTG